MTTYIIPICDKENNDIFIKKIIASSFNQAQDKARDIIINEWEWDENIQFPDEYHAFVNFMKQKNIIIGDLTDIELI